MNKTKYKRKKEKQIGEVNSSVIIKKCFAVSRY